MKDIGSDFKSVRISSSVSLDEASKDTNIPVFALEQIEEGNIGIFKDIFELKEYLEIYSKYLGLDSNKVIDDFNEYMFEYTSKIPTNRIEKAIKVKEKEQIQKDNEANEIKVVSPYLSPQKKNPLLKNTLISILIIVIMSLAVIFTIKIIYY